MATTRQPARLRLRRSHSVWAIIVLIFYLLGLGSGYGLWGLPAPEKKPPNSKKLGW